MSRNDNGAAILDSQIGEKNVRWKDTYSGQKKRAGK